MGSRVRIACIDANPSARESLREEIQSICGRHRHSLQYGVSIEAYAASREEVFLSQAPDAFVIGPRISLDASHALCSELRKAYPRVPLILFLSESAYSLRVLRRFESMCDDVFSESESELRIIHALLRHGNRQRLTRAASIFNFISAKGGVGQTSIVVALADALVQRGKRVVVLDLSRVGTIPFYLGCGRWESRAFAQALREEKYEQDALLEDCVIQSTSGIHVLVPPAGGSEIRDIWLHREECLEVSLSILDSLGEQFDVILVDNGHAEGLLPFAISCRAKCNSILSSNEASAVHLAGHLLAEVSNLPAETRTEVLINDTLRDGLQRRDTQEFLSHYGLSRSATELFPHVPYDGRGRYWVGSGDTFYGLSGGRTKETIENIASRLLDEQPVVKPTTLLQRLMRQQVPSKRTPTAPALPALPAPIQSEAVDVHSLYEPPHLVGDRVQANGAGWKQH